MRPATTKYLTITSVIRLIIIIEMMVVVLIWLLSNFNILEIGGNDLTLFSLLLFSITLLVLVEPTKDKAEVAVRVMASLVLATSFLPRFIHFFVLPFDVGRRDIYGLYPVTSIEDINRGLILCSFYVLMFSLGLWAQRTVLFPGRFNYQQNDDVNFPGFQWLWTRKQLLFFAYFVVGLTQISLTIALNWKMTEEYAYGWLIRLLPFGIVQTMVLFLLVYYWKILKNTERWFAVGLFIFFNVSNVLHGSRSFLYILIIKLTLVLSITSGNFRLSVRLITSSLITLAILSPIVWITGTAFREGTIEYLDFDSTYRHISERLGAGADNFIVSVSYNKDHPYLEHLRNPWETLQRGVNTLLPGELFDVDDQLRAGHLFKVIYYNESIDKVLGEWWPGFGFAYAMWGPVLSFISVFFTAFIFTLSLRYLLWRNKLFSLLIATIILNWIGVDYIQKGDTDSLLLETLYPIAMTFFIFLALSKIKQFR